MKRILAPIVIALTFSVGFSSTSSAGWTKVTLGINGDTNYVDFERIRKVDGFVYFWELINKMSPNEYGDLSYKIYNQGDCRLFRFKILSVAVYNRPMGRGTREVQEHSEEWVYPSPSSTNETVLKEVCSR